MAQRGKFRLLHKAAKQGKLTVVEAEVMKGVNPDGLRGGVAALHHAAKRGHADVVELLTGQRAGVSIASMDTGRTPLHEACSGGNLLCVRLLLEAKAPAGEKTGRGFTPLHIAANHGYDEVVALLLDNKADST